jgi:hypothetical protein
MRFFFLVAAGCMAGVVNAVAGGGTLLTFPVLLMCGTPPVMANATITVGLVIGTAGSIVSFRTHLKAIRHLMWRFIYEGKPPALLGDSQSLTVPGVPGVLVMCDRSK